METETPSEVETEYVGRHRWVDPTYGRIDRDIQSRVERDYSPVDVGTRVALENNLQARRDRGRL